MKREAVRLLNELSRIQRSPDDHGALDKALSAAGPRMRELRIYLGWTQTEFAQRLGVNPSFISLLEQGKRRITLRQLAKVCSVFQVRAEKILGGVGGEPET